MLTEYEARKLQEDMKRELNSAPGVVAKCAAGLLIIVALALFGSRGGVQRDFAGDTAAAVQDPPSQHSEAAPIAESGKVMEERRKGFQSQPPAQAMHEATLMQQPKTPDVDEFTLATRAADKAAVER